ncbi:MAG: hypothetical protein KatS3mg001_403 [Candidatus Pacearchaeota archaeon]|nr:MAG: hypothetical protein KatS3mg001_403 [Candidatus Pacearchaeota archaeon]
MNLEDKIYKLNEKIENLKIKNSRVLNSLERVFDLIYILDVGGSLIRKYQLNLSKKLGWTERDLTIRNAIYCGIIPSLAYIIINHNLESNFNTEYQKFFYSYPIYMSFLNLGRIFYSSITKKAIGSFSIYNLVCSSIYFFKEQLKKIKEPAEGIEPSAY